MPLANRIDMNRMAGFGSRIFLGVVEIKLSICPRQINIISHIFVVFIFFHRDL